MATIYEVSSLAGVSLATVSRVINNNARVSDKTRKKVEIAMLELGYRPNSIAQSLASNCTNSVGILVSELHGAFFGQMMAGIESELRASGKHVIITTGHSEAEREKDGIDFLHAGKVRRIDVEGIKAQLSAGAIPIISPIGYSVTGEVFNLLAEEVATQVAIDMHADKLIGFCSNQGVLDEDDNVISELLPDQAQVYIDEIEKEEGQASGTLRFLRAAVAACKAGVKRSHLISYQQDGALLKELFTRDGTGTQIVEESYEQIRTANIDDIGGLLQLIEPLEKQGILVKRSRELLENEIEHFSIIERDGMVIGCAALYPFTDDGMGELACLVSHPKYRRAARADNLVAHVERKARKLGIETIFVLTTQSIHWFRERGFEFADINQLPAAKKELYNLKRNSKVLIKKII